MLTPKVKFFFIVLTMTFWLAGAWSEAAEYTQDEIVAACLILEAGGEENPGMQAVLNVIKNRSSPNKSMAQVVLRKWQFSCFNAHTVEGKPLAPLLDKAKSHIKWKRALDLVQNPPQDVTGGADHYFADYIKPPKWAKDMKFTVKIGRHLFYRSR